MATGPDLIVLSIPAFFVLILLEIGADRLRGGAGYRVNDALASISCGIGEQVTGAFLKLFVLGIYGHFHAHFALFRIPSSALSWLALFLAVDFLYYWFHRISHEVNALWAGHVVHHQSEEYNLSTALRQSWTQKFFSFAFYLPLAVIGFPPEVFFTVYSFMILYQFWIHTRMVGRLGVLELFLNTPSHHRVHHGVNPRYLDRNHGATLIVWDRIFGTFQAEEEAPIYGTTRPFASFNPLWLNVVPFRDLAREVWRARGLRGKMEVLARAPGPGAIHGGRAKYDPYCPPVVQGYAVLQYLVLLGITARYLNDFEGLPPAVQAAGAVWLIGGTVSLGALLESRRWARVAEALRILVVFLWLFL